LQKHNTVFEQYSVNLPKFHLLAEGEVVPAFHHHLHKLTQLGFDLNGMDNIP